jgi:hypothetical protein
MKKKHDNQHCSIRVSPPILPEEIECLISFLLGDCEFLLNEVDKRVLKMMYMLGNTDESKELEVINVWICI